MKVTIDFALDDRGCLIHENAIRFAKILDAARVYYCYMSSTEFASWVEKAYKCKVCAGETISYRSRYIASIEFDEENYILFLLKYSGHPPN